MKENNVHFEMLNLALREHPEGISIQEVADFTGIHRNTAAKYLEVLQSQGEVDVRRVGVSKLFFISRRVPFTCVLRLYEDPVIGIDRDLRVINLNASALSLIGTDEKSIIGNEIWSLEHLLGAEISEKVREIIKGQWDVWENGQRNPALLIRGIPVKFNGSRTGAAILCIDQNKALAVKTELDRSIETLRMITRYQTEYLFRLSPDMRYTWVNPAYARLFNLNPDTMVGSRFSLSVPDNERNQIIRTIYESKPGGSCVEYKVHLPHGDIRYHQVTFRPDEGCGDLGGFIGVGRDITEYKFKEDQFKRFYDGTEEILGERTKELRNLNHQLYREIASREQAEKTLRSVEFAVQHVADLIIWFDASGRITYLNKAAGTTLKFPDDGESPEFFSILPEPPDGGWEQFWESLRRDQTVFYETLLTATDGRTVPVEILFNHLVYGNEEYCCCIARDIHKQKQAMGEIIESENRFRQLADTIPEAFFLRDNKTGTFLYINHAYEEIFDQKVSGLYLDPGSWRERIHPDDMDLVHEQLKDIDRNSCQFEFRIIRSDGAIRWLDTRVFPVPDPHNQPYRTVGVISDITERRLMEEELRLLNDRLTTVIRAAPVSLFYQDRDLRYIWVGQSAVGFTQADLIGNTDADLFPPEVAATLTEIKRAALKSDKGTHADVEIQHSGRKWTVRMFMEPFRDITGHVAGITVASIDLTDLFLVKEALRESEEKYRRLFDETSDICLLFSIIRDDSERIVDFGYLDLNQRALDMLGQEKRKIIGKKFSDMHPDIESRWAATLRTVAEKEEPAGFDGFSELFHRHVSVNAYPIGNGRIGMVIRDISDIIRASELVENQRDLALTLSSTDDLAQALSLILDAGKKVSCIDAGGIYFMDRSGDHLIIQSHFGLSPPFIAKVDTIPVTPHMKEYFGRGEPVYYLINGETQIPPSTEIMLKEGLKFFVVLPILKNGLLYAILNLASHSSNQITVFERSYLEALSAHLGETLERLRRNNRRLPFCEKYGQKSYFQVLNQDGDIIETSFPDTRDGNTVDEIRILIQNSRTTLMCGQEVTGEVRLYGAEYPFRVRLRFIPWDGEIAYLAIWERSVQI